MNSFFVVVVLGIFCTTRKLQPFSVMWSTVRSNYWMILSTVFYHRFITNVNIFITCPPSFVFITKMSVRLQPFSTFLAHYLGTRRDEGCFWLPSSGQHFQISSLWLLIFIGKTGDTSCLRVVSRFLLALLLSLPSSSPSCFSLEALVLCVLSLCNPGSMFSLCHFCRRGRIMLSPGTTPHKQNKSDAAFSEAWQINERMNKWMNK